MIMNVVMQEERMKQIIGENYDKIDIHSEIDSSLSFSENQNENKGNRMCCLRKTMFRERGFSFDFGRDCREIKLHAGDEDFHELLEQKKRVEEIRNHGNEAGMCSRCYENNE